MFRHLRLRWIRKHLRRLIDQHHQSPRYLTPSHSNHQHRQFFIQRYRDGLRRLPWNLRIQRRRKLWILIGSTIWILRSKEHLVHKNSKRSHNQSDKTSQLLKLIKWSTLLIRTETESSTTTSSSASSPRTIQRSERYDALFDLILSHFSCFFLLSYKMHLINDLIDLWNLWNLQMKRFWITFWALNKRNLYYEHFNFIT